MQAAKLAEEYARHAEAIQAEIKKNSEAIKLPSIDDFDSFAKQKGKVSSKVREEKLARRKERWISRLNEHYNIRRHNRNQIFILRRVSICMYSTFPFIFQFQVSRSKLAMMACNSFKEGEGTGSMLTQPQHIFSNAKPQALTLFSTL